MSGVIYQVLSAMAMHSSQESLQIASVQVSCMLTSADVSTHNHMHMRLYSCAHVRMHACVCCVRTRVHVCAWRACVHFPSSCSLVCRRRAQPRHRLSSRCVCTCTHACMHVHTRHAFVGVGVRMGAVCACTRAHTCECMCERPHSCVRVGGACVHAHVGVRARACTRRARTRRACVLTCAHVRACTCVRPRNLACVRA